MMSDWTLRRFRQGDDELVVALWNATLTGDPISPALFRRQTLLDPSFRPEGCLLAERGAEAVGFTLAVAPAEAGPQRLFAAGRGTGRIAALGVLPATRGRGIGGALLDAAAGFLRERGCGRVVVAAHEYYAAGVDKARYAAGLAFLQKRGFVERAEAVAMGRELYDLEWPDAVRETEARLLDEGIEIRYFDHDATLGLADYFRAEFPTWVEFFIKKLDAGHPLDEMVIATHGERVVGYCQHLDADHVGPFGVAAAYRGRGIGTVMLYRLLDRMRQKGYKFAWFGETGRARHYYERAGFRVTRVYAVLGRDLERPADSLQSPPT
jgi:ribosomal protein S18 acetylase RimI-like enzyme